MPLENAIINTAVVDNLNVLYGVSLNGIAVICVTKSRTGNYDFRACARVRGFPGSTVFGRTHTLRRVCRAITR